MKKITLDKIILAIRVILIPITFTFLGGIIKTILEYNLIGITLLLTYSFLLISSIIALIKHTKKTKVAIDYNLAYILYLVYLLIISFRITEALNHAEYYQYISNNYIYTNFSILSIIAIGLGIITLLLVSNKKSLKTKLVITKKTTKTKKTKKKRN